MSDKKKEKLSRRDLIQALGIGGLGAALVAYQNCSPVAFDRNQITKNSGGDTATPTPFPDNDDDCIRSGKVSDAPICEINGNRINGEVLRSQAQPGDLFTVAFEHRILTNLHTVSYFDQDLGAIAQKNIFTVEIGANPTAGQYHPIASSNLTQDNKLTDLYIFDSQTCELLRWHRFSSNSQNASVMMVADDAWITQSRSVKVVVRDALHGYWGEDFTFSSLNAIPYSNQVATFDANLPYGGSTLHRPYIGSNATGGQGDLGQAHAPHIRIINDNRIEVTQGNLNMRHGVVNNAHYINGAALYDQHGHFISNYAETNVSRAGTHNFIFDGLSLSARGIREIRAVTFDTFNGYLMGFKRI